MTGKSLDKKIEEFWPGIGSAARAELVKKLMASKSFKSVGLNSFAFCDLDYPSDHRLYILTRYLSR